MYRACFVWNIEKYWENVMLSFSQQLSFFRFVESLKSERARLLPSDWSESSLDQMLIATHLSQVKLKVNSIV